MKTSPIAIAIAIAIVASALTIQSADSQSTSANTITAGGFQFPVPQPQYPFIIFQPNDQCIPFGSNATFSVTAENVQAYQWYQNGNVLPNATNSILTIQNAQVRNVGLYSCDLYRGFQSIPTRSAQLQVYTNWVDPQTGVDPIVVYSFPYEGGGAQGTCPGNFTGYVSYTPSSDWGWIPDTTNGNTVFTAVDQNRANTKVQFVGEYGDIGCNQTTVTVPNPPMSPQYEFFIYFPNNVPTNAYPLTLSGFSP